VTTVIAIMPLEPVEPTIRKTRESLAAVAPPPVIRISRVVLDTGGRLKFAQVTIPILRLLRFYFSNKKGVSTDTPKQQFTDFVIYSTGSLY